MDLWEDMLAEFRALGGTAENICLRRGPFGRGLFPMDSSKPYRINIPVSLLVDVRHIKFENDVLRVSEAANIGPRERAFIENYEREFSWGIARGETRELLEMMRDAPEELRQLMRSPFNADAWLTAPTTEWVQQRYLGSRAITFRPGTNVVMPIVELANHGQTSDYEIGLSGVGIRGQTAGEILVQYRPDDALGIFIGWGFAGESEPLALSLSMGVERQALSLMIRREQVDLTTKSAPYVPQLVRDGDKITLSYLMLGHRKFPHLPRAIFYRLMRGAGRQDAAEIFDLVQHINWQQWIRLIKASEGAASPLGSLLRHVARCQLAAMSHTVGAQGL